MHFVECNDKLCVGDFVDNTLSTALINAVVVTVTLEQSDDVARREDSQLLL